LNLGIKVVVGILGFPIAAGEFEDVQERAIGVDVLLLADGLLLLGMSVQRWARPVLASNCEKAVSVAPSWTASWSA